MAPISSLRNLGPATEAAFLRAGISTAEEILEMGGDAAYAKLLESGIRPHFIGYYALHMALQGRPWNDCRGAEKDALRERFAALKTSRPSPTEDARLEQALDAFGVGRRR